MQLTSDIALSRSLSGLYALLVFLGGSRMLGIA